MRRLLLSTAHGRRYMFTASAALGGQRAAALRRRSRDLPRGLEHYAGDWRRPRACQLSSKQGGASDDQGQPPSLPLHKLIKAGQADAVSAYIQSDRSSVDRADPALNGTTPLLLALRLGRTPMVEVLLEHGADVNLAGAWGLTPLMYGAVFGREEAVSMILKRGGPSINIYATDVHGSTALAHAQAERQHGIVSLLVEHLAAHGDGGDGAESAATAALTHSASGFNIKPMVSSEGGEIHGSVLEACSVCSPHHTTYSNDADATDADSS